MRSALLRGAALSEEGVRVPLRERVTAPPTYRPSHPGIAEWRPVTPADLDAVLEVVRAIDAADHPNYLTSREQLEEELGYSFIDREADTLLAIAADGRVAAVGIVMEPPRQETPTAISPLTGLCGASAGSASAWRIFSSTVWPSSPAFAAVS